MNPVAFTIYNIEIKWYSIFIMLGIILSWLLINKESKKYNIKKEFITNLLFWTIIFGILGARIYYCIFEWEYYQKHILEIFKVWNGGLAIHGGIILGAITVILYTKKYKVSSYRMLDIISPYLLLAQSIGRWGNFFNSEVYGNPTTYEHLHNLKIIPEFVIQGMNIDGIYYEPLFYYESLWCLLGFILILILRRLKYTRLGWQTASYLMWYSLGRFIFEGMRMSEYNLTINGIKVAQIMSVILFIIGLIITLLQQRKPKLTEMYNTNEKIEVVNF